MVAEAEVAIRDLIIGGVNSATNNPSLKEIAFIYYADGMIRCNVVKSICFGEPMVPAAAWYCHKANADSKDSSCYLHW